MHGWKQEFLSKSKYWSLHCKISAIINRPSEKVCLKAEMLLTFLAY